MTISKYETSTSPKETFAPFDGRGTHSLKDLEEFHFIDQIANKVKNHDIQKLICSGFLPLKNNRCNQYSAVTLY